MGRGEGAKVLEMSFGAVGLLLPCLVQCLLPSFAVVSKCCVQLSNQQQSGSDRL